MKMKLSRGTGARERNWALGRLKAGTMNKMETAYAEHLEILKQAGEILWYQFEAIRLRLAQNIFYTPDFLVMAADGVLECRETKGFWQEDARLKIKVAAAQFPFRFMAIKLRPKKDGGGWEVETF